MKGYHWTGGSPGRKGRTPVIHSWIITPRLQKSTIDLRKKVNVAQVLIKINRKSLDATRVAVLFAGKELGR